MTKVTTPSQLKAELESQKTYLLEACLMAGSEAQPYENVR